MALWIYLCTDMCMTRPGDEDLPTEWRFSCRRCSNGKMWPPSRLLLEHSPPLHITLARVTPKTSALSTELSNRTHPGSAE